MERKYIAPTVFEMLTKSFKLSLCLRVSLNMKNVKCM